VISRRVVNASPLIFLTEVGLLEVLPTGVGPGRSPCAGTAQAGWDVYVRSAAESDPRRSGGVTVMLKCSCVSIPTSPMAGQTRKSSGAGDAFFRRAIAGLPASPPPPVTRHLLPLI